MTERDARLHDAIAAIWVRHRDTLFARLTTIEAALETAGVRSLDTDTRAAAHRDAHKLAGALGTFGLHDGTDAARAIEHQLAGDDTFDVEEMKLAARRLRASLEGGPAL